MGRQWPQWAALLSLLSVGHGQLDLCEIPESGGYPALNLNPLHRRESEYAVASLQYEKYDYAFNLCGPLGFTDSVCLPGSSVCSRIAAAGDNPPVAESVYGLVNMTEVERGSMKDMLNYTMSTAELCPGKSTPFVTMVNLVCDPSGSQVGRIRIQDEDWLGCAVTIEFETALVCSEPPRTTKAPPQIAGFTGWQFDAIVSGIAVGGVLFVYLLTGYTYLGVRGYKGWERVPIPGCCAPMCRSAGEYTEL